MATPKLIGGLAAGAVALAGVAGYTAATQLDNESTAMTSTTGMGCEDWAVSLSQGECFAAGIIRNVALYNLQGAAQFCKWRAANPGEWTRLKGYASTEVPPPNIVTWLGASIRNDLEAYFATGAPSFTIEPNTAPNVCKTPLPPPAAVGVTPGQTDATVTITP